MIERNRIAVSLTLLALVAAVPALAGTPINETKSASAAGTVTIDNLIGSITVEGWDRNEIQLTGSLGEGPERLEFEVKGDRAEIKVIWPERGVGYIDHDDEDTDLNLKVPMRSSVNASGVNTEIEITGIGGDVDAETVNGSIEIGGSPESVDAETVNGGIKIDASTGEVSAETVNGTIRVTGAEGELEASTVNGTIEISGGPFESCDLSTVSGSLSFRGELTGNDEFSFETHSGEVEIYLPADIEADFEVSTFSGDIDNEFGPKAKRTSKYAPGKELEFSTGSGGPTISASSFSGRVSLKKK